MATASDGVSATPSNEFRLTRRTSAIVGLRDVPATARPEANNNNGGSATAAMSPIMSSQTRVEEPRVSGGLGRVFRAVRHVRQNRERVQCELLVERLQLRVPSPKKVSFEWIRGPKRVSSSETHTLHKNVWTCQWSTPLVLIATLFWTTTSDGEKRYASKETCIRFLDSNIAKQKESRLGEVVFDLAEAAQSKQYTLRATVPLAKSLDPNARVSLKLTVAPISGEDGGDASSSSEGGSNKRTPSAPPQQLADSTKALLRRRSMRSAVAIMDVRSASQARGDASPLYSDAEELTSRSRQQDSGGRLDTSRDNMDTTSPTARRNRAVSREVSMLSVSGGTEGRNCSNHRYATRDTSTASPPNRKDNLEQATSAERGQEKPLASATSFPTRQNGYRHPDLGPASVNDSAGSRLSNSTPVEESAVEGTRERAQQMDLRKQLEKKNQQISSLMEQLTALHGALEASGKMNALDRQAYESQLNKGGMDLNTFKPALWQLQDSVAVEKKLNADLQAEKTQLATKAHDLQRLLSQQQGTLDDVRKGRDSELNQAKSEIHKLTERCKKLEQALQHQRAEALALKTSNGSVALKTAEQGDTVLRGNLERELDAQRYKIRDLEKHLKEEREKATSERLRASETIARLKEKLEAPPPALSPGSPLSTLTKGELINKIRRMEAVEQSGESNRIVDLEEELVNVKVRLAQVETEKEEVIEKARKRIETLKASCREYALTIDSLEREVATLKLGSKRSSSLLKGSSHVVNM